MSSCPASPSFPSSACGQVSSDVDAEQLYREHAPALFRYLVRFTGDPDEAAEVLQDTFVRLLDRPPWDPRLRKWLFRVATNLAQERRRTQSNRLRLLAREPERVPTASVPMTPDEVLAGKERRDTVRAALAALAERDRVALLMRSEGFSHREIAEALGTTTGSVGTVLNRAMTRLAAALSFNPEAVA